MVLLFDTKEIPRTAAFTGFRPQKLPFEDMNGKEAMKLKSTIKAAFSLLIKQGYRRFLTGGALGSDLLAAEAVEELKAVFYDKGIKNIICAPCIHYTEKWNPADKKRLLDVANKCDKVYFVSMKPYYKGCMHERNRFLVDNSSALVAVYDNIQSGGTQYTVDYALKNNKTVLRVDPYTNLSIQTVEKPEQIEQLIIK